MYAKGVYEYTTVMAMKRALHLVEELGCGKVSSTHIEVSTGNSIEPKRDESKCKNVSMGFLESKSQMLTSFVFLLL